MKLLLLAFMLPTLAFASGDGFLPKEKAEALDSILRATDRQGPKENDARYRARREKSFLTHDEGMKAASVVWVSGAVARSGYIEIKKGMRAGHAMATADGFSPISLRHRLVITRLDERLRKTTVMVSFSSDLPSPTEISASPEILPGDRLYAPEEAP